MQRTTQQAARDVYEHIPANVAAVGTANRAQSHRSIPAEFPGAIARARTREGSSLGAWDFKAMLAAFERAEQRLPRRRRRARALYARAIARRPDRARRIDEADAGARHMRSATLTRRRAS
jgi:hypothetical protein